MIFISRIRYNPESSQGMVLWTALHVTPQLGRQPVRSLPLLERRAVELELQRSRQRLELPEPRSGLCQKLHFAPGIFPGGVCFMSCPCQPPSIFPISSSFSERAIYFLLSSDFVSQRTIKSTLSVSNFRITTLTYGSFSDFPRNPAVAVASIMSTKRSSIFPPSVYRWPLGISR